MEHYAGLDVSIKETSVCIIDGTGRVVREVKVPTEPEASRHVGSQSKIADVDV